MCTMRCMPRLYDARSRSVYAVARESLSSKINYVNVSAYVCYQKGRIRILRFNEAVSIVLSLALYMYRLITTVSLN